MHKMKRSSIIGMLLAVSALSLHLNPPAVHAEEPDFSDTSYWNQLCTGTEDLSEEE